MDYNQTNLNTDQPLYTDEEEKHTLFNKIDKHQNKAEPMLKVKSDNQKDKDKESKEHKKNNMNDDSLGMIDEKENEQSTENKKSKLYRLYSVSTYFIVVLEFRTEIWS